MVTGGNDPAFTGVYKMSACEDKKGKMVPVMKFSDNPEKTTNPGNKQVWRIRNSDGTARADVLTLEGPDADDTPEQGSRFCFWHPSADYRHFYHVIETAPQPLLKIFFADGKLSSPLPSLSAIRAFSEIDLDSFDNTYKRLLNPHVYKISITEKLRDLKLNLIKNYLGDL